MNVRAVYLDFHKMGEYPKLVQHLHIDAVDRYDLPLDITVGLYFEFDKLLVMFRN